MIRTHSPDGAGNGERKRRRKVLSCYDCRRRKLQCDRAIPACGRCVKAGQADNCLYLDDPVDNSPLKLDNHSSRVDNISARDSEISNPAMVNENNSRLEYQDRRIKQLEAALLEADKRLQSSEPLLRSRTALKLPLTPESIAGVTSSALQPAEHGIQVNDRETMLLRGRSFKTQFFGSTHPSGLIAHLAEMNSFTKEAFDTYPGLNRIRADLKALDLRQPLTLLGQTHNTDEDLMSLLPSKEEADSLLQLYWESYGILYNIVHMPTFWKEYNAMWLDTNTTQSSHVAIVLLMIAATQCLDTREIPNYTANSSTARDKAVKSIIACENWLGRQTQKHVNVAHFQIRFLLLLSKQTSAQKFKRIWTETGEFLRFCMSAGLHRNPELVRKKTTALDREMRKRIWAAAVEFELQASLDRGMVPQNWPTQSDAPPPGNYHDDQLEAFGDTLPAPKPAEEFTCSSYMAMSSESIVLRHQLTSSLNNIRQQFSFEDIKKFSDDIEIYLDSIPKWTNAAAKIPIAKLSLMLRQFLLVLHDRQMRQAETRSERTFSRMIIINTATQIIETHRAILDGKCHALQLLCHDQVRAALSLCYAGATADVHSDSAISQVIEAHTHKLMKDVIEMLRDKTVRYGREQRQLWIALAAHGCWKSKLDPGRRSQFIAEAVEKIVQPYYKMMACQENRGVLDADANNGAQPQPQYQSHPGHSILEYTRIGTAPSLPLGNSANLPDLGVANISSGSGLLDLDEIGEWTFEDWTFTPADFQQAFGSSVLLSGRTS